MRHPAGLKPVRVNPVKSGIPAILHLAHTCKHLVIRSVPYQRYIIDSSLFGCKSKGIYQMDRHDMRDIMRLTVNDQFLHFFLIQEHICQSPAIYFKTNPQLTHSVNNSIDFAASVYIQNFHAALSISFQPLHQHPHPHLIGVGPHHPGISRLRNLSALFIML